LSNKVGESSFCPPGWWSRVYRYAGVGLWVTSLWELITNFQEFIEIVVKQKHYEKWNTHVRFNDNRFIGKRVRLGCSSFCQLILQLQPYVGYRNKSLAKVNKHIL
jgi:hypothetical protein